MTDNDNKNSVADPGKDGDNRQQCPGGSCSGPCGSCSHEEPRGKLHCTNWLEDIPGGYADSDFVEVQFKNTRKGYYKNSLHLPLSIGDMVVVEAQTGQDLGTVSLTGVLVDLRMRRLSQKVRDEVRRVCRLPRPADLDKYREAKAREHDTMIRARRIAESLDLNMKIGDVEYQGDGGKAIFYYIADERVDFRQLIKVLAETFHVRIEMKQIGARQEAGRIGGIGPCGRPLCCASWMSNFVSVATSAARYQDLSLNPQKLAGQCAKLKCCLNFEVDAYVEGIKRLPSREIRLETADNTYYHFKTDIFKREITYSTDKSLAANLVTIDADRAFEVIEMNKAGEKPLTLMRDSDIKPKEKAAFGDILGEDDLTRFDNLKRKKKKKRDDDRQGGQGKNERKARSDKGEAKPRAEKKQGDKPRQEKPQGDKPRQEKPQGDRPRQEKPRGGQPGQRNQRNNRRPQTGNNADGNKRARSDKGNTTDNNSQQQ